MGAGRPTKGEKPKTMDAFYDALTKRGLQSARVLEIDTLKDLAHVAQRINFGNGQEVQNELKSTLYLMNALPRLLDVPRWKFVFLLLSEGLAIFLKKYDMVLRSVIERKRQSADLEEVILDMESELSIDRLRATDRLFREALKEGDEYGDHKIRSGSRFP